MLKCRHQTFNVGCITTPTGRRRDHDAKVHHFDLVHSTGGRPVPLYLISHSRKWTIILAVYGLMSLSQTSRGLVFAFMTIVITPVLIIYFALQRYAIDGLTAGALKG